MTQVPDLVPLSALLKDSGERGLDPASVISSRERFGENRMTPPRRIPAWRQYLGKFNDPIIRILLVAVVLSAGVSVFQGENLLDTLGIIVAVVLATGISFLTEYRSNREFDALQNVRDKTRVRVVRGGGTVTIPMKEVVVGDIVVLEAGDAVPSDGYILASLDMAVDEAAFTGESEPVEKEEHDLVLKGTWITAGRGRMITAAVGDHTRSGRIAASLYEETRPLTPLQVKLIDLSRVISRFGYLMAGLIMVTLLVEGYFTGGYSGSPVETAGYILNICMLAVVVIVVAVPEGLPVSVTISLALAMQKMTRAFSLVKQLLACETIGSVTVICTDKTGTLTMNRMEVVQASVELPASRPSGVPGTPGGWIALNAAVNSTADLEKRDGRVVAVGNSTEGALLRWLVRAGIDFTELRIHFPPVSQELFDSRKKMMSTTIVSGGHTIVLVKGAPELVAGLCSAAPPDLEPLSRLSERAMRTLAFAHGELPSGEGALPSLLWDGYVGIRDDLRPGIAEAVRSCREAGIRTKMVTGDSPETAQAIARETGILGEGIIITGSEFRGLTAEARRRAALELDVLARSEPLDKFLLVQDLQAEGEVVAVTGDGTNDAPALRQADVGLAMGINGTEVAREAADIILLDDSYPAIKNAVWWGRALYENIQRFLVFQLTINVAAAALTFLAVLFGLPPPFTIVQLLWINIIMDSLAAIALCSEAPHATLMEKSPVPRHAPVITPYMKKAIGITATLYVITGIVVMMYGFPAGFSVGEQSTAFFTGFVLAQVWNGVNCRALNGVMPPFIRGNPVFFLVMGAIVLVQAAIVQYGGDVFGTVPLSPAQWVFLAAVTAPVLLLMPVLRYFSDS
jgi:Ca2+-transporting ATPase